MKSSTMLKMKSSHGSDEIEAQGFDEMKSPTRRRGEFHPLREDFIDEVDFTHPIGWISLLCCAKACAFAIAAEQKARVTYDNILRLCDDPDVCDPIKYLRQREIVHYQRFGDALRITQDHLDSKNFYAINPSFDKMCGK